MNANRTPLKQNITERVIAPIDRARFHPDTGIAHLSAGHYKGSAGTQNQASLNFFDDLWNRFTTEMSTIFNPSSLKGDDIFLDVVVRTQNGNQLLPNLRLAKNALSDKNDDDIRRLNNGEQMYVKITYDGGKPSEVTPTSWVFETASAAKIEAENTVLNATGGTAPAAGTIGSQTPGSGTPASPLSSMENVGSSFKTLITNHPALKNWAGYINYAAGIFGVDANLIAGIVMTESSGNPNSCSGAGAMGLMQLEPTTWPEAIGDVTAKIPKQILSTNAYDPLTNILAGTAYFNSLLGQLGGDHNKAICAYNAGAGTVQMFERINGGYPYGVNVIGNGANYSETGGSSGDPINDHAGYLWKVRNWWQLFSARSATLGDTKINQRQEVSRTDQTNATANSAHNIIPGANS